MDFKDEIKGLLNGLTPEIFSAIQFYEGDTNNSFLPENMYTEETRKAPKAYVTLNTLLDTDAAEEQRFREGKRQIPELITVDGVKKILDLYGGFYDICLKNPIDINIKICAMKRCSELESPFVRTLTSTTKLSPDEIYSQGYGNKIGLALCHYKLHKGALAFDFEKLGDFYLKKKEREILLMPGNKWEIKKKGVDENYKGADEKPATIYEIDVYPPDFDMILEKNVISSKEIIYDPKILKMVENTYKEVNKNIGGTFPKIPPEYWEWKHAFQQKVYELLRERKISYKNMENGRCTKNIEEIPGQQLYI